jgi:thiamine transport system ATP-binding protein
VRRSAWRCADVGELKGSVLGARVTPEVLRLVVDVEGVGEVQAVADRDSPVSVGHDVRLRVDLSRTAVLPDFEEDAAEQDPPALS